jgi:hypothetical protein
VKSSDNHTNALVSDRSAAPLSAAALPFSVEYRWTSSIEHFDTFSVLLDIREKGVSKRNL